MTVANYHHLILHFQKYSEHSNVNSSYSDDYTLQPSILSITIRKELVFIFCGDKEKFTYYFYTFQAEMSTASIMLTLSMYK